MALDIKDLAKEGLSGNIDSVGSLSKEQMVGVLAQQKQTINQSADTIDNTKGIGVYGLTLADLQLIGIIKKGIAITTVTDTVKDGSIFTGVQDVYSINDITASEDKQKQLYQLILTNKNTTLTQSGKLSTDLTAIAVQLTGNPLAASAVTLAVTKGSSILTTISGIGGGATKAVKSATDTIPTPTVDAGKKAFIGDADPSAAIATPTISPPDTSKATKPISIEDIF